MSTVDQAFHPYTSQMPRMHSEYDMRNDLWRKIFLSIEQLPRNNRLLIWKNVSQMIMRLDAFFPNHMLLSPDARVCVGRIVQENRIPKKEVARKLKIHRETINKGILGSVRAAVLYCLPDDFPGKRDIKLTQKEQVKYDAIQRLVGESEKITRVLNDERVNKILCEIPHLKELLENFADYSTISHQVTIYTPEGTAVKNNEVVRNANSAIRAFFFTDKSVDLHSVARRMVFARWKNSRTNVFYEDIDQIVLTCLDVLSHCNLGSADERYHLRMFLDQITNSSYTSSSSRMDIIFENKFLRSLKEFVELIVKGCPPESIRFMMMNNSKQVSADTEQHWVSIGVRVLENILTTHTGILTSPELNLANLFRSYNQSFREARQVIRTVVKELNIV